MYKIKKSRLLQKDNKGEGEKMGVVSTKNQFSANIMKFLAIFFFGKSAVSPSILARTQLSSITIYIFGKLKYGVSFVILRSKLTVVALLPWHSPKMANIWDEPRKMTHT